MIRYLEGDLFCSPAQTIVNTVNTVGVMGKGIALEFKKRYPDMFRSYQTACEKYGFHTGQLMLLYEADHWILLFPTKKHWRNPSKLEYIEQGLAKFVDRYADKQITSVAFPRLGCGNGELAWKDVKPLMEQYLGNLPIDVYIYLRYDKDLLPEHKNQNEMEQWLRSNARDLSVSAVKEELIANCRLIPYVFFCNGQEWNLSYNSQFVISDNRGRSIEFTDDDLFIIWDEIRTKGIFPYSEDETKNIIYTILFSLGFLTRVRIETEGKLAEGYQVNEGCGRKFVLEANGK